MVGDSASVQRAIEQFMVGRVDEEINRYDEDRNLSAQDHKTKQAEKRYYQIYKAFCSFVKGEWMAVDDQLANILESIANIRSRLPIEANVLELAEQSSHNRKNWKCNGFSQRISRLPSDDIRLALSYDFIQHEKMMASARTMLSTFSDCQGALGRKLDEMMKHHLEFGSFFMRQNSSSVSCHEKMNEMYLILSMELHRKQCLIHVVVDSNIDEAISMNYNGTGGEYGSLMAPEMPMKAIKRCCVEWPRGSKHSFVDTVRLSRMIESCEV